MVSGSEWMYQLGEFLNRDGFLPDQRKGLAVKRLFQEATSLLGGSPIDI